MIEKTIKILHVNITARIKLKFGLLMIEKILHVNDWKNN